MAGSFEGYAGLAAGAGEASYPQTQLYNPYGFGCYGIPAAPAVPQLAAASNSNSGTQSIQGSTVQSGTFKGHGTGARIVSSGNIP